MSDQQKITEFSQSAEQKDSIKSDDEPDEFGWGSFGKPPEDWPVSRVEELFEIQKDSADPEELDKEELVRLYSMPAFDDGEEPELTKAGDIGSKKFHVPNQALLFPKLNISKKRFWLVSHSHDGAAFCSTEYWPLLPADGLNLEFYLQYFNSDSFINRPRLSTSSTTNSHQRIKSNLFDKVRLPSPPLEEQRKIATVLYTVDQAIEKTEEIIEQVRTTKQGIIQDVMNGKGSNKPLKEKRVGPRTVPLPEDWEVVQIGEAIEREIILEQQDGNHGSDYPRKDEFVDEGVPYLSAEMLSEGKVDFSEAKYLTEERANQLRIGFAEDGDVLLAHNATVGPTGLLKTDREFVIIGTSLTYYRCNPEKLDNKYLTYFFQSNTFQKQLQDVMRQSTRNQVPITRQQNLNLILPPIEEQRRISEKMDIVLEKLQNEKVHLDKLQNLKKGLMQDLLSGTVRTTDTNIEVPDEIVQHG